MENVEELNEDQQMAEILGEASTEETDPTGEEANVSTEESTTATPELSEFNPEDWKMKVSGNDILPQSREQLINLAQMGHSYSDNMAKINEERRVMNEQNAPLAQYKQMDDMFKSNPEFQQHMANAIQQYKTNDQMGEETPAYVQQLLQRVESVESYKTELQQKNADKVLVDELSAVKTQYPDVKWDIDEGQGTFTHKLLKHAFDNNINSLNSAFRDLMYDNVAINAKAEALKTAELDKQASIKAGKVGVSTNASVNLDNLAYDPKLTYNELMDRALQSIT